MNRKALPNLSPVSRLWLVAALTLLWQLCGSAVLGQDPNRQAEPGQNGLVAQLSSVDQEQRLNALVQLGAQSWSGAHPLSQPVLSALVRILNQDSSPQVRALAARTLALTAAQHAETPLIAALPREKQVAVRKAIIYALEKYPSPQVIATLIPLLKDKNHEIRAAAALSLSELSDPACAGALTELLENRRGDDDAFARSRAARGLGRISSREAIGPLLKALSRDKSEEVKREAARALGLIATNKDLQVIEALRQIARSPDPYLVIAADNALTGILERSE